MYVKERFIVQLNLFYLNFKRYPMLTLSDFLQSAPAKPCSMLIVDDDMITCAGYISILSNSTLLDGLINQ